MSLITTPALCCLNNTNNYKSIWDVTDTHQTFFALYIYWMRPWVSVIAACHKLDGKRIESQCVGRGRRVDFPWPSRPAPRPTDSSFCAMGTKHFRGVMRPEPGAKHPHLLAPRMRRIGDIFSPPVCTFTSMSWTDPHLTDLLIMLYSWATFVGGIWAWRRKFNTETCSQVVKKL
jgi:hypothetical protein